MSNEISAPAAKAPMNRKKLLAMLATVVIIAGGITVTSVSVANANAEETARLCAVALTDSAGATKKATASIAAADAALAAVKVLELPASAGTSVSAGTSTDFAARAGVAAVKAVPAVTASDGVEAVAGVEAVPARASGADLVGDVSASRAALTQTKLATTCTNRDQAASLTTQVAQSATATKALNASIVVLTSDFAIFQTDEAARIAAEIEAARVAAEIEAARVAAEAAAAEAARVAANQAAAKRDAGYNSGSGSSGGGGGSSSGGSHVQPGGGGVGTGGSDGKTGCRIDNGVGGFYSC